MNLDLPIRPRRLRRTEGIRRMVRETTLRPENLVAPLFLTEGADLDVAVPSMPGVRRMSVDVAATEAARLAELGIGAVLLFGIPETKDATGSSAWDPDGVVQRGIGAIRSTVPDLPIITDVCLCEYTDHGHCGLLDGEEILNDASVALYARTALSHAVAGADIVAPSDMMDGRVAAIREVLDDEGYDDVAVMSYAVKYASAFYGPFRDLADSSPAFGDRRSHQMDPANGGEALREAELDEDEGADFLIVKPAMPNLDILFRVAERTNLPVVAYQVSGEYAMLQQAFAAGLLDRERTIDESLIAMRRAGAQMIITYFAGEWAAGFRR